MNHLLFIVHGFNSESKDLKMATSAARQTTQVPILI